MRIDYKHSFDPRIRTSGDRRPRGRLLLGFIGIAALSGVALTISPFDLHAESPVRVDATASTESAASAPAAVPQWQSLTLPALAPGFKQDEQDSRTAAPARPGSTPNPPPPQLAMRPAPISELKPATPAATRPALPTTPEEPEQIPTASNAGTAAVATTTAESTPEPLNISEHRIRRGENLASIFKSKGLGSSLLHEIVHSSDEAERLARIRPGQTLRFHLDSDGSLQRLELKRNPISTLRAELTGDTWNTEEIRKDVERRKSEATGVIESSLFADGQKAGLTDAQIMELAAIFGWDIDFALEIRAGDRFSLVYEEQYLDGEKFQNGPILAAEFVNRGTTYQAIRYEDSEGNVSYYDAEGRNKRRAFIRTPVKFARISSRFTTKRWHPVLKRNRSHKGVDYAAPTGTPIKATGSGKVVFRGTKGGYGRTVIIRHGGKYTTLYAHLSKYARKVKSGSKVKQGQVIGYVGRSGLATGPHLHYEFRVNGVHRNPLRVKLPKALPLPKSEMKRYLAQAAPLLEALDATSGRTLVADAAAQKQ